MSRQDDFDKASRNYSDKMDAGILTRTVAAIHYHNGAEHGYQYAIDKACKFLEKYAANFVALPDEGQQPIGDTNAIYGTKSLLYYLRKEMEE